MPPKSAKKEPKSLWLTCDKCETKVIQSKLKSHDCETLFGVINEKFQTPSICSSLPAEIDVKDAPGTYLQRFLFVPEAICTFCNFTMGCNLLIQCNGRKHVLTSWTISDKHMDEVYSISAGSSIILIIKKFINYNSFRSNHNIRAVLNLKT